MRYWVWVFIVLITAGFAVAQQPSAAEPTNSSAAPLAKDLPKPSPEMQRFSDMVLGTWRVEETHGIRKGLPSGGTGSGMARFRLGPGGLSVIEDYASKNPWGDFVEHGLIWWNPQIGAFQRIECETITTTGCKYSETPGKWEGNVVIFRSDHEQGGRKLKIVERYTQTSRDAFTVTMDAVAETGETRRVMTVTHTRVQ